MFKIEDELKMFEKLKYDGCEEAMTKEKAMGFYIPVSVKYFKEKAEGKVTDQTSETSMEKIRDVFFETCYRLRVKEFSDDFFDDRQQIAEFYTHRGKMLGIDTSFIRPELSGDEIFEKWIEAYWRKVSPPILNPALGEYMFASRAIDSEMFWCFLIGSAGYLAIETAYRYGFDPVGIYRQATLDDPLSLWTYRDEAYLYQKWRDDKFLEKIKQADDILALGAGGMPELRHTGYFEQSRIWSIQNFFACDPDPRIDFDFLMSYQMLGARERINYRRLTMSDMICELVNEGRQFDLIYVKGVISFMKDVLGPLTQAAMDLLRPGGKFIFDMQLSHFAMMRDACIFGWGGGDSKTKIELLPLNDATAFVIKTIEESTERYGKIDTEVFEDPFYHDPFGMNVIVEKPA